MSQATRMMTSPWLLIAICAGGLTISYETVVEQFNAAQQIHAAANEAKANAEAETDRIEAEAELAMARISNNCIILFDHEKGIPARSLNGNYQLINPDGVALIPGQPVCASDGETGIVVRRKGKAIVGDKASVPVSQLNEYQNFYKTYPEVLRYERNNSGS